MLTVTDTGLLRMEGSDPGNFLSLEDPDGLVERIHG